jgi:hypothetical protein
MAKSVRNVTSPNIVIPVTAHAAFWKAGDFFCVEVREVDINKVTGEVDSLSLGDISFPFPQDASMTNLQIDGTLSFQSLKFLDKADSLTLKDNADTGKSHCHAPHCAGAYECVHWRLERGCRSGVRFFYPRGPDAIG